MEDLTTMIDMGNAITCIAILAFILFCDYMICRVQKIVSENTKEQE
jgi:hypothetical protein